MENITWHLAKHRKTGIENYAKELIYCETFKTPRLEFRNYRAEFKKKIALLFRMSANERAFRINP